MSSKCSPLKLTVALVAGLSVMTLARAKDPDVDWDALAAKLVSQNAGVREGDVVTISGSVRDLELLEDLAVHVRKLGAHPRVTVSSERVERRLYADVPVKYDSQEPTLDLKLAELIDVQFLVETNETLDPLQGVPPERIAARAKASQPVAAAFRKRNVRQVFLGNEMYPIEGRAAQFGLSPEEFTRSFWNAVNTDYAKLQSTGATVKAALADAREVKVTHPNGTDLTVDVQGRRVLVSDGVISDEDVKQGGAAVAVWLPAGEVYVAPVPGTAQGKFVVDRLPYRGKEILGLELVFDSGKLTSMTAKSGLEGLKADYDAAAPGKEQFAIVDIGINADLRGPQGPLVLNYVPAGMVTIGIGDNAWAGGENSLGYFVSFHLAGATLKAGDKTLVENGALKL